MDLIYTNAKKEDLGVLFNHSLDLSFGADENENDFELTLNVEDAAIEYSAIVYIEGTEYGGIVDGKSSSTGSEPVTYKGRTWHGMLNSKVIKPDTGADYFTVSGDANAVLASLITRLGLSELFEAAESLSGINISSYQFKRYCKAYDGIRDMLSSKGAKLKIAWKDRFVQLSAVPIVDYSDSPVDGDIVGLNAEHYENKVNHLICLGRGELAAREVYDVYSIKAGSTYYISDTQQFTGIEEITDVFDYSNAESYQDLKDHGIERMKELIQTDKAEISDLGAEGTIFDIGDIVPAHDRKTGIMATATVTQKIVKITNGTILIEYKTGG